MHAQHFGMRCLQWLFYNTASKNTLQYYGVELLEAPKDKIASFKDMVEI